MKAPTLIVTRDDIKDSGSPTLALKMLAELRMRFADKCVERMLFMRGRILPGEVIGHEEGDAICDADSVVDVVYSRQS